jgi:peptide/nickel transport system ATP-binding protein
MAHHVVVMYAGEIVESAPREQFFRKPAHPYSRKLFASLPDRQARERSLAVIRGRVPSLAQQFAGCRFVDRCDFAMDLCRTALPAWNVVGSGHGARCHLYNQDTVRSKPEYRSSSAGLSPVCGPVHPDTDAPLLRVDDLKVHFPIRKGIFKRVVGYVKAVDGVTLSLRAGRTLALVGESGSGKTTVGKGIVQLLPLSGGSVNFGGVDLSSLSKGELRGRRRDFQIIFQDPFSSLNPRMRVLDVVEEGMIALGVGGDKQARAARVESILAQVGLGPEMKYRYPHEFSGGQRQRIAIARALAVEPRLIICDEPTSALDVSVQAQILNLLRDLQSRLCIAYLFITHNMSAVEFLADDVAVMYLGKIVEQGKADEILLRPQHAYTKALLSAVPRVDVSAMEPETVLQ